MKSYFKFGVALCVIAFSVSAFAGSMSNFNYSAQLSDVPNTTLKASFSYNTKTDTFTKETLTFVGGIFNGLSVTITKPQQGDIFKFDQKVNGDTIAYTIVFNPLTGTYDAYGSITKGNHEGYFQYNTMAPEGGSQISYLAASALALLAGILLAGKQRRPAEN